MHMVEGCVHVMSQLCIASRLHQSMMENSTQLNSQLNSSHSREHISTTSVGSLNVKIAGH